MKHLVIKFIAISLLSTLAACGSQEDGQEANLSLRSLSLKSGNTTLAFQDIYVQGDDTCVFHIDDDFLTANADNTRLDQPCRLVTPSGDGDGEWVDGTSLLIERLHIRAEDCTLTSPGSDGSTPIEIRGGDGEISFSEQPAATLAIYQLSPCEIDQLEYRCERLADTDINLMGAPDSVIQEIEELVCRGDGPLPL